MVIPDYFSLGICFGHQIICRALGGEVGRNPNGWEIGPTTLKTTPVGRLVYGVNKIVSIVIYIRAAALNSYFVDQ
jgi:GMP synthase-like glutamine amidotransferase